ncbi:MAG: PAS domain-containing protein [Flavobacteriales bacterium]
MEPLSIDPPRILAHLPVGLVTIDKDLRYTYANIEAERFAGMPRDAFVGRLVYEVFPALRGSPLDTNFSEAMRTRTMRRFDLPFPPHDTWYEIVVHPAEDGGLVVFFHDVKRRIQHQQEVEDLRKQSESARRLFDAILTSTPDFVYVWGPDHKFRYANQALLDLYGVPAEKCIGHGFRDVGYPEWHARMHEQEIDEVVRTAQPLRGTVPFYGKGGGGIYDYIFVPVFGADGEVEAVAGITRDVTELDRANKALQEADRRKDEFLATLAHELRNPLAPLRTGIDLLATAEDLDTVQETQRIMERQVDHMVHLVDDLIELSRISRGTIELRRIHSDLRIMLQMALETARPLIEQRGHTVELHAPDRELPLNGDPTRLAQIFGNVLNNAAKYTHPGGRIDIHVKPRGQEVEIDIADNGIGMTAADIPRIFDMFTQVDGASATAGGGLGIGLHIVKRLVEMHGGRIEARSPGLGAGSTFTITLPLGSAPSQRTSAPAEPAPHMERRIMIVDDNVDAAFTLSLMLKKKGHQVHATNGAQEALDVVLSFRPEFIFLDIGMPGLDGYEACRRLRAMPQLKDTRIIALTGWGQEEDRKRVREAGFDEHLVKPVQLAVIEATLAHLDRGRH